MKERLSFLFNYHSRGCLGDLENSPQVSRRHLHCQNPLLTGWRRALPSVLIIQCPNADGREFSFSKCVHVHLCSWVWIWLWYATVCLWSSEVNLRCWLLPSTMSETRSLGPVVEYTRVPSNKLSGILQSLPLPHLAIGHWDFRHGLLHLAWLGSGDPNSDPHAGVTSALHTELLLHPNRRISTLH